MTGCSMCEVISITETYNMRLITLEMLSLEHRRLLSDELILYKIKNNIIHTSVNQTFQPISKRQLIIHIWNTSAIDSDIIIVTKLHTHYGTPGLAFILLISGWQHAF